MEERKGAPLSLVVASLRTWWTVFLFLVALVPPGTRASEFCADINTGSSFQSGSISHRLLALTSQVYSLYQSVGACSGTCSGYAFAILQGHVKLLTLDVAFAHEPVVLVFELFSTGRSVLEPLQ